MNDLDKQRTYYRREQYRIRAQGYYRKQINVGRIFSYILIWLIIILAVYAVWQE